jgi:hypothetical protein
MMLEKKLKIKEKKTLFFRFFKDNRIQMAHLFEYKLFIPEKAKLNIMYFMLFHILFFVFYLFIFFFLRIE